MGDCASCKSKDSRSDCPDPLDTLSKLCLSMPGMDGCAGWKDGCAGLEQDSSGDYGRICGKKGSSQKPTPMMRMYFHTGFVDYILFEDWVPTDSWTYSAACAGVVAMGIFSVLLKQLRAIVESQWFRNDRIMSKKRRKSHLVVLSSGYSQLDPSMEPPAKLEFVMKCDFVRNMLRATFGFFLTAIDFLLMLIAMTFNYGLFFSVCLGYALGFLAFGHCQAQYNLQ